MPFTKEEAIEDQMIGNNQMDEEMMKALNKIGNTIDLGAQDLKWARRVAAEVLGLPVEALWLYSPWSVQGGNAARSDKALFRLRQEWKDAGYEFTGKSMLVN